VYPIRCVQGYVLLALPEARVGGPHSPLDSAHGTLHVDGLPTQVARESHAVVAHLLEKAAFALVRVLRGDGRRAQKDPDLVLTRLLDDAAHSIEVLLQCAASALVLQPMSLTP
jgi:hypothetical protein